MAQIFLNVGKKVADIDYSDRVPKDAYDTTFNTFNMIEALPVGDKIFDKTSVVDLYNSSIYSSVSTINSGQGLMENYYRVYGYTSLIGDAVSYLTGTKDASSLLQSGLSTLIPGATNSGIGTFLIHSANIALRSPFISNIINTVLPSPFNLRPEGVIRWQSIPSQLFLASSPPPGMSPGATVNLVGGIIGNAAASLLASTVSGLSNSGTLTSFDWDRAFGKGLATAEIILMAQSGLKYTEAVAWYDPTRPTWCDRPGFHTYDKYIGYSDGVLNYSTVDKEYKYTLIDRFKGINAPATGLLSAASSQINALTNAPIPTNVIPLNVPPIAQGILGGGVDTTKAYQASLGNTVNPDTEPERKYTNGPDPRDPNKKIGEIIYRLGFPLYNKVESIKYNIPGGWNDAINIQDLIEDNSYTYENATQRDIIDFKFEDISSVGRDNPIIMLFRAAITGLTDDFSPTWNGTRYLGRPDNFYTYDGFERKISFDMKVYCNSKNEVVPQWRKLNRLAGMCYPVSYSGNRVMKAPIMRLTIGNLYRRTYGFLDSFGLTIADEALWDTELGYQLPMIINAKIGFTVMYEAEGQGAPMSDLPHFNQGTSFPQPDGTGQKIYGNRFEDKIDKSKSSDISDLTPIPVTLPTPIIPG